MINIGICEDEKVCRESIGVLVKQYFQKKGIEYQLREYNCGKLFMAQGADADILILDIEMEGMSGIEIKDSLCKQEKDVRILFVTKQMEVMPDAFGRNVYGFLHKPVELEQLEKYFDRMIEDIEDNSSLVIKSFNREFVIQIKNIYYFVSENKYSHVISKDGDYFCDKGLGQWEEELKNQSFFRCHKSYLVNFRNIYKIGGSIFMYNGDKIPVSRRKGKELKDLYRDYAVRKAR